VSPPGGIFLININVVVYYMPPILPSCSKLVRRNRLHRDDRLACVSFLRGREEEREKETERERERLVRASLLLPGSQSEPQNSLITRSPNRPYIAPVGGTRIASLRRWQLMECGRAVTMHLHARVRLMQLCARSKDDSSVRSSLPEETLAHRSRANYF